MRLTYSPFAPMIRSHHAGALALRLIADFQRGGTGIAFPPGLAGVLRDGCSEKRCQRSVSVIP